MPYAQSTHPETIRQILKRSLKLYRQALRRTFTVAVILSVVSFIPRLVALITDEAYFTNLPVLSAENLWLILIELIGLVLFTILLWRTECVMDKTRDTIREDLSLTFKKLPEIIGAVLVQTGILLTMFFMTVGIFYFMLGQIKLHPGDHLKVFLLFTPIYAQLFVNAFIIILLMFYLPLILAENKHIFEALGKSAALVWGNWWRTFILILIPWFAYLIILMLVKFALHINIHIYFEPVTQLSWFATLVQILLFALFIPWLAAVILVMLRDLELRKKRVEKQT